MALLTNKSRNTRKLSKDEIRGMKGKDHKMVKGIFRCYEPRGGNISFSFKKYAGDDLLEYSMKDGDIYTIPLMVAKHLNQNCWYPKHTHVLDSNGNASVDIGKKVNRCSFESLEFQTEDEEFIRESKNQE